MLVDFLWFNDVHDGIVEQFNECFVVQFLELGIFFAFVFVYMAEDSGNDLVVRQIRLELLLQMRPEEQELLVELNDFGEQVVFGGGVLALLDWCIVIVRHQAIVWCEAVALS